jgi:hypothetical protein
MSGIESRGRRGFTVVPNWRWEDPTLDPYDLRVAGWLASHADSYLFDFVSRNAIVRHTHISRARVSSSLTRLVDLAIIEINVIDTPQAEGGKRFRITFDFDVWEGATQDATRPPPRTPGVHPQDATRPPPGRHTSPPIGDSFTEEHGEEQPPPTATARSIAQDWWDYVQRSTGHTPVGYTFMALVKMIEPLMTNDYPVLAIKGAIKQAYDDRRPFTRQVFEQYLDGRATKGKTGRQLDALSAAIAAEECRPDGA